VLIGDCASDPPLSATAQALARWRADDVVYGLGAVALARGHRELALAVRDDEARAALAAAIARLDARVAIRDAAAAWPAVAAAARDELIPADVLVAVADEARGRARLGYVTVAGAVQTPLVLACAPSLTMAELAARAGGAVDDDWVPIAGGAPAGRLVARETTFAEAGSPSLLLILPATHALVRRLRLPLSAWLWRAASACANCRQCSDACPAGLSPHELVTTLATGRDDGMGTVAAATCTGCGLCDAVCPSALSPRALVVALRDRLRDAAPATVLAGGEVRAATLAVGLDLRLLTLRLDLTRYEKAVSMDAVRA
jgi:Na+-translocating ferredoxin:NAD+ oxidoreductase RnfC subunit